MKPPTPQNRTAPLARADRRPTDGRIFPDTDFAFHGATPKTGAPIEADGMLAEARSFRKISRQFLEEAAGREYLAEALVLGSVALTAAWPLGVLVNQLTTMMIVY